MPRYSIKIEIYEDERYLCFTPLPELGQFETWEAAEDFANWLHDQASFELQAKNTQAKNAQAKNATKKEGRS
jgi:hypothetical protein